MKELLSRFEAKKPTIVFEWADDETDAEGWVVINSLRGGAAGGGTRMRKGLDKREVESLAKTMELKFTVSGPNIGGAKSGINFDPSDPRKDGVLRRWYAAVMPLLKQYYGTGGDLNVCEINEVIPITEEVGVWHPQEGVFNGHFSPTEPQKINRIGQLRAGVNKIIEDARFTPDLSRKYTTADMVTGYGVAESIVHFYELYDSKLEGKRVVIQGWGNVGAAAGFYLSKLGAMIVGIIDRGGGLLKPEGFSHQEITDLFLNRDGNKLVSDRMIPFDILNDAIWDQGFEIFVPAAASRLVTGKQVDRMIAGGLELIASGANVPFADEEIFFGPISEYADGKVSVIPDFIANCGMARVFTYLMSGDVKLDDQSIFQDISTTIFKAIHQVREKNESPLNFTETAFQIALEQLTPKN